MRTTKCDKKGTILSPTELAMSVFVRLRRPGSSHREESRKRRSFTLPRPSATTPSLSPTVSATAASRRATRRNHLCRRCNVQDCGGGKS